MRAAVQGQNRPRVLAVVLQARRPLTFASERALSYGACFVFKTRGARVFSLSLRRATSRVCVCVRSAAVTRVLRVALEPALATHSLARHPPSAVVPGQFSQRFLVPEHVAGEAFAKRTRYAHPLTTRAAYGGKPQAADLKVRARRSLTSEPLSLSLSLSLSRVGARQRDAALAACVTLR